LKSRRNAGFLFFSATVLLPAGACYVNQEGLFRNYAVERPAGKIFCFCFVVVFFGVTFFIATVLFLGKQKVTKENL